MTDARPETVIRLENAGKVYAMGQQQVTALDGIDAAFEKGSFWAVMGSSGSGKSTLMNVIGCLDRLTSGRYLFQGTDISAYDDDALSDIRLKHLGFIFQSFNLIPSSRSSTISSCRCTTWAGTKKRARPMRRSWHPWLDWKPG